MKDAYLLLTYTALAFSALLPVINPIGSAVIFLGFSEGVDRGTRRVLARRIAVNTFVFLGIVLIAGTQVLHFFGISLPIVQVAGGFVISIIGWRILNEDASAPSAPGSDASAASIADKVFYPFTFPLTAGPGCMVVTLTLSAHALKLSLGETLLAHAGMLIGIALSAVMIYFSYAYADILTTRLPGTIAQGIVRVLAFILVCIGAQISWNGIETLVRSLH
jgi:multiple antibiotic resistance protein